MEINKSFAMDLLALLKESSKSGGSGAARFDAERDRLIAVLEAII